MLAYEIKGNLFSSELLENITQRTGQNASDFAVPYGLRLPDEIARTFAMVRQHWDRFSDYRSTLADHEEGTKQTRDIWAHPLMNLLGIHLERVEEITLEERSFVISHQATNCAHFPCHIASFRQDLDTGQLYKRTKRASPHVEMQTYLNHTEHLYGIICNGFKLRLLRDHHRLTGIQYLEWDLEQIMESNDLASFTLLFRMLHHTRLPRKKGGKSYLEEYHQDSIEEGHRIRGKLQRAVKRSLEGLGDALLRHPKNESLRAEVCSGPEAVTLFGQQLRKFVYRLLFLMVAEERSLIFSEESHSVEREVYQRYYSVTRLRLLAERKHLANEQHTDLWAQLRLTLSFFGRRGRGRALGINPLGSNLFEENEMMSTVVLGNRDLLKIVDLVSRFDVAGGPRIRINYQRINVEEFGAVYESLLDLNPMVERKDEHLNFSFVSGADRKTTGAYYTHDDLVRQLLKTALKPVIADRLQEARGKLTKEGDPKPALEAALLDIKVLDPACGSGHFLLGAARTLAHDLAKIRAGEGESLKDYYPLALRHVIERCVYGVDINPDAVELCRLVLWLEAQVPGHPIAYLDHKIKCGNSLVGFWGEGTEVIIPDGAFRAGLGDQAEQATLLRRQNAQESKGVLNFQFADEVVRYRRARKASSYAQLDRIASHSLEQQWEKQRAHERLHASVEHQREKLLFDLWTYAFFQPFDPDFEYPITQGLLNGFKEGRVSENHPTLLHVQQQAAEMGFFHWWLEFPDVFGRPEGRKGFDVVLGNPPWERIKLLEKEFFETRLPEINEAGKASKRKRMIAALGEEHPVYQDYVSTKRRMDRSAQLMRTSGRFPLSGKGEMNTYQVFSELKLQLLNATGRLGTIVPTGIATDFSNQEFFQHIVSRPQLRSLYDFTNTGGFFPNAANSLKFSLLTIDGNLDRADRAMNFSFFNKQVADLERPETKISLLAEDLRKINPNTKTCPVFRTAKDAELTRKVYQQWPVLIDDSVESNAWGLSFWSMYNMTGDSRKFIAHENLKGKTKENQMSDLVPLYEGKMIWHYNHRYCETISNVDGEEDLFRHIEADELSEPNRPIQPRYWVRSSDLELSIQSKQSKQESDAEFSWFLCFRDIATSTNERTCIPSVVGRVALGNTLPTLICTRPALLKVALTGQLSSVIFDFWCRQKVAGNHVNLFLFKQLPIIPPEEFHAEDLAFIVPRVMELTYTAWDLKNFADDVWHDAAPGLRQVIEARWQANRSLTEAADYVWPETIERKPGEFPHPPFRWEEKHRHVVQCELDAYFAWKYKLSEEDLLYILDPHHEDSMGPDFPGETFRVLKEKEIKKYEEFRTRRLVLDAWRRKPWERPDEVQIPVSTSAQTRARFNPQMALVMSQIMAVFNQSPRYAHTLGHTKMEKILHLADYHYGIDLGRQPIRDHYGPADIGALTWADSKGEEAGYFKAIKVKDAAAGSDSHTRYYYEKLDHFSVALQRFAKAFSRQRAQLIGLCELMLPFDRDEMECKVTLYAAWNDLLLQGVEEPSDDEIIQVMHHEWGERKRLFTPEYCRAELKWLRENGLTPKGTGGLIPRG